MTHQKMRLTVEIPSRQAGHVHPVGTTGIVVEPLGANTWLVEVCVPDATLEGDAWYETLEVYGDEFELVQAVPEAPPPVAPHENPGDP